MPTTADHQLDLDAIAARDHAAHARRGHRLAEQPDRRGVSGEASLRAVNALCRERGLFHIHDEAYEYFTYDGRAHFSPGSIAGAPAHTISLYSMSKAYGMASWRVGYMVIPEALWDAINKIQDTLLICAPVGLAARRRVAALGGRAALCRRAARRPRRDAADLV